MKRLVNMYSSLCCCTVVRYNVLPRGRMLFTYAKQIIQQPRQRQLGLVQTEILSTSNQMQAIIKRQLQIKPEKKKSRKLFSLRQWDHISPEFTQIYENQMTNWIWFFYVSQVPLAACTCMMFRDLFNSVDDLPSSTIQAIIAFSCFSWSSMLFITYWSKRVMVRIYHNAESGQFVAVRRTCFGRLKKLEYTSADIAVVGNSKHILKRDLDDDILVKVKGHKVYLKSRDFILPMYYNMHLPDNEVIEVKKRYDRGPLF